jgi:hypothetical protein
MSQFLCRSCKSTLRHRVVDLGMSPLCESYVPAEQLNDMEPFYPLHVWVCDRCWLVQLDEYVPPESIFGDYAYFSSFSSSWLAHAEQYVQTIVDRLALGTQSLVVELGSNDGYLLQYFVERQIPCLGIEPAANVAASAIERGIPTEVAFFGQVKASEMVAAGRRADLVLGNNVLAQVPDLNDFVAGIGMILSPNGTVTIEFPHVLRLLEENQFDTIYHEHFCYFSLISASNVFERHGMVIVDVEEIWTHGGSLRIYARHAADPSAVVSDRVHELRAREEAAGLRDLDRYARFEAEVRECKWALLDLLISLKRDHKTVAAYGAPGKGNTLLNYCGIRTDLIDFTVDRNPYKQGRFLPGTHIPIYPPDHIDETRPDFILILPWNFKDEILQQLAHVRDWGGQFIVPIPHAVVI